MQVLEILFLQHFTFQQEKQTATWKNLKEDKTQWWMHGTAVSAVKHSHHNFFYFSKNTSLFLKKTKRRKPLTAEL